jgi:POT family proton-dependent oligopeptide transporter
MSDSSHVGTPQPVRNVAASGDHHYATAPIDTDRMPPGIPYIIGNEAAERFSFYGMRGILTIYMTQHLRNAAGEPDYLNDEEAKFIYHIFVMAVYFFPIVGSLISDVLWGKYKTILLLSLGYCVGHACLALGDTGIGGFLMSPYAWLLVGLGFISVGSGAIKPCVSAHVGDQFGKRNKHLISRVFSWFYFSINVGAAASSILTPILLAKVGPWAAFGLPGVLMAVATLVFWMGRDKFAHIPPAGAEEFTSSIGSPEGLRALANLSPLFLIFVPMFWALFDQTGSAWVLQATRLELQFLGIEWYESQIQFVNPVLILILIPTFTYVVYPLMGKLFEPTPLRKIGIGLFVAALAFSLSGWIETNTTGGAVKSSTSQGDAERWSARNLIDDKPKTPGWASEVVSPKGAAEGEGLQAKSLLPQEIVLRLRENKSWPISRIELVAPEDISAYLESQLKKGLGSELETLVREAQSRDCRPRRVVVSVADAPNPLDGWTNVAEIEWPQDQLEVAADFDRVTAQYVKVLIEENWGGPCVALENIRIRDSQGETAGAPPLDLVASGDAPNIGWQFLAYLILTSAEVMVSIVCLEFAYTQAPSSIKSFIMGIYLLGVSLGNLLTAVVNKVIQNPDGSSKLDGANYYWFFTAAMFIMACLYVIWSQFYRGQTYIQGDDTPSH